MELKRVQEALDAFGALVVQRAKDNLKAGGKYGTHNASGKLSNSLNYKAKVNPNSIEFDFYAEDYWKELDFGTKGSESSNKAPNSPYKANALRGSIDKWVVKKGLKYGVRGSKGQFINRQRMVTLITNSINRTGTPETKFFRSAFDKEYENFNNNIADKYGFDLEEFLKFTLKDLK